MTLRTLGPFFALAFGLTWGLAGLFVLFPDRIEAVFGEVGYTNPLFVMAVYSPAIAAVFLVWRHHGAGGLHRYFRRFTLWRMPLGWWGVLLIGIPALFYLGAALSGNIADPFPFSPWHAVIPALAITMVIGPVEEIGWRGLALPLLQRRLTPLAAGLILGVIWAVWHLPAFVVGGTPQSGWAFTSFFVGVVAISVILTAMFNAARGSLLVAALFHFQLNNPIWPDAQPWDALAFGLAAGAVVVLNREAMLTRGSGATDVLMPEDEPRGKAPALPGTHEAPTRRPL